MVHADYLTQRLATELGQRFGVPVAVDQPLPGRLRTVVRLDRHLYVEGDAGAVLMAYDPGAPIRWGAGRLFPVAVAALAALNDGAVLELPASGTDGLVRVTGESRLHRPIGVPRHTPIRAGDAIEALDPVTIAMADGRTMALGAGSMLVLLAEGDGLVPLLLGGTLRLAGTGVVDTALGRVIVHRAEAELDIDVIAAEPGRIAVSSWLGNDGWVLAAETKLAPPGNALGWREGGWQVEGGPRRAAPAPDPAPVAPSAPRPAPAVAPPLAASVVAPPRTAEPAPAAPKSPRPREPVVPLQPPPRLGARVRLSVQTGVLECNPMLGVSVIGSPGRSLQLIGALEDINRALTRLRAGGLAPDAKVDISVEIDGKRFASKLAINMMI